MTRHLLGMLLPAAAILAAAGPAGAQYPYPYPTAGGVYTSPLSPYLNLQNGRGLPGVNYYNFVRPGLQAQQQQYSGNVGLANIDPFSLGSDLGIDPTKQLPRATGSLNAQPAAFMNYGSYFNNMGTIGGTTGYRGGQQTAGGRAPVPSVPRR
jgi:hypothetical protein